MSRMYEFLHRVFHEWMFSPSGLLERLRWHRFEVLVLKRFYPSLGDIAEYEDTQREIVASTNSLFFTVVEEAASIFEEGDGDIIRHLQDLTLFQSEELEKILLRRYKAMIEFHNHQYQMKTLNLR